MHIHQKIVRDYYIKQDGNSWNLDNVEQERDLGVIVVDTLMPA